MKKQFLTVCAGTLFTAAFSMTAFAGGWRQDASGKPWFEKDTGAVAAYSNCWDQDSAGNWFMGAVPADNGWCSNGWWWILDPQTQMMKCYYFDAQGYMLMNTVTPDGFQVNEKGEWVKDGVVQTIYAPKPHLTVRADFDSSQYVPGTYEANAAVRLQSNGWQKDATGWWYKTSSTQWCGNGWWWIFDSSVQGMKCYYFDSAGYMLANAVTPDGFQVNEYGEWVVNGVVQVIAAPKAQSAMTSYQVNRANQESYSDDDDDDDEAERRRERREREREQEEREEQEREEREREEREQEEREEREREEREAEQAQQEQQQAASEAENAADVAGMDQFLERVRHELGSDVLIDVDGDDVTVSVVGGTAIDEEIFDEMSTYESDWTDHVYDMGGTVENLYDDYKDYGLRGTLTVHLCAETKDEVRLTFENEEEEYDVLYDTSDFKPLDQEAGANRFKDTVVKETVEDYRYEVVSEFQYSDSETEVSGADVTVHLFSKKDNIDNFIYEDSDGWEENTETYKKMAAELYEKYQKTNLGGTLTLNLCMGTKTERLLTYKNGEESFNAAWDNSFGKPTLEETNWEFRRQLLDFLGMRSYSWEDYTYDIYDNGEVNVMVVMHKRDITLNYYDGVAEALYEIYSDCYFDQIGIGKIKLEFCYSSKNGDVIVRYINGARVYDNSSLHD